MKDPCWARLRAVQGDGCRGGSLASKFVVLHGILATSSVQQVQTALPTTAPCRLLFRHIFAAILPGHSIHVFHVRGDICRAIEAKEFGIWRCMRRSGSLYSRRLSRNGRSSGETLLG